MSKKLANKVALVTGGSRGIGAAIARALADDSADVAISYVASPDKAKAVVAELLNKDVRAHAFKADQADAKAVEALVQQVVEKFGQLDILVNNAGVFTTGQVHDRANNLDELDRLFAINVNGVAVTVRAAAPLMLEGGRIITIGSTLGESTRLGGVSDYSATKAAIVGYTRGWARDLGAKGITVNAVQPGPIDTDMNPADGEFADTLKATTALGRRGKPDEVAAAVAFLASPSATYITGTTLNVDGGFNA